MSFHEVQFPTGQSYGTSGGPSFKTTVVEMDNGTEFRISRWDTPRRRYNVGFNVKSRAQLNEIQAFFIARRGAAYGFRFKDWVDFTTASDGVSSPSHTDQEIGVGDGTTTQFQLKKTYEDAVVSRTRNITKPVSDTVLIGLDGVNQGAGWSVNSTTGIVTFSVAPSLGEVVTQGCEFDVPVRFTDSQGEILQTTIEDFHGGKANGIELLEVLDEGEINDEAYMGGSSSLGMSADYTLSVANGRVIYISSSTPGLNLRLPATPNLVAGGPYFIIVNKSANAVLLRKNDGSALSPAVSMAANSMWVVVLAENSGVKTWYAGN